MSNRTLGVVAAALASLIASPQMLRADPAITLDARLAQPVMKDGVAHKNYLRVASAAAGRSPMTTAPPVNVAFVIDRSGSMSGDRHRPGARGCHHGRQPPAARRHRLRRRVRSPRRRCSSRRSKSPTHAISPTASGDPHRAAPPPSTTACCTARGEVLKFKDPRRLNRVVLLVRRPGQCRPLAAGGFRALGRAAARRRASRSAPSVSASATTRT